MASNTPLRQDSRIPELDGLRGIAIGMILVLHYFLQTIQATPGTALAYSLVPERLAWSGVDLFFVLSGFLIGGILLDQRSSTTYFRTFYIRRFLRIVPIYFVYFCLAWFLSNLIHGGTPPRVPSLAGEQLPWFPHLLFLQNFWMAARNTLGQLSITWSLAIEEQFYITLPFLVRFLPPRRLLYVLFAGILAAPLLRAAIVALWPNHPVSSFVLMPCRADSLLLGVLGAALLRIPLWRARLESNRKLLLGLLALFAGGFGALTIFSPDPYGLVMLTVGLTWLSLFYLTLLLSAVLFRDTWISAACQSRFLRWLGSIAYGLYLFHGLVLAGVWGLGLRRRPAITATPELLLTIGTLFVAIVLCKLSWTFFERPLVNLGHRFTYEASASISSGMPGLSSMNQAKTT